VGGSTFVITIERVPWSDPRGEELRARMDDEMHERYAPRPGDEPEDPEVTAARDRSLSIDVAQVITSILALDESGEPVGHIAVRWLGDRVELKRLIVLASARGKGAATALLAEAEQVGREQGVPSVILQTGDRQPEAVALYGKTGWTQIPVYEPYAATMPWSFCFEKAV
jgi:GNAT superfamily N-acetyltransferase